MRSRYRGSKQALPAHAGCRDGGQLGAHPSHGARTSHWRVEVTLPPKPEGPEGIVCSHRESQGLIDQTKGKRKVKLFTTKLTPHPDKCQGQFCSLQSESDFHRRLIRHKSAAANLRLCNNLESASLAKVNVTSKRTTEVTISIALDSYRTPI